MQTPHKAPRLFSDGSDKHPTVRELLESVPAPFNPEFPENESAEGTYRIKFYHHTLHKCQDFYVPPEGLALYSKMFATHYKSGVGSSASLLEVNKDVAPEEQFSQNAFRLFIKFAYAQFVEDGEAPSVTEQNVLDLYYLAQHFQCDSLTRKCIKFLEAECSFGGNSWILAWKLGAKNVVQRRADAFKDVVPESLDAALSEKDAISYWEAVRRMTSDIGFSAGHAPSSESELKVRGDLPFYAYLAPLMVQREAAIVGNYSRLFHLVIEQHPNIFAEIARSVASDTTVNREGLLRSLAVATRTSWGNWADDALKSVQHEFKAFERSERRARPVSEDAELLVPDTPPQKRKRSSTPHPAPNVPKRPLVGRHYLPSANLEAEDVEDISEEDSSSDSDDSDDSDESDPEMKMLFRDVFDD
jgi:hypothetical protein